MRSAEANIRLTGIETSVTLVDTLLYVSRSLLPADTERDEVAAILATARARNRSLGVTGALMFTRDNFAQLLEGPREAIDELMAGIQQDPRHAHVRILREERNVVRRFGGWEMAYDGPSIFVARHVRVLAASFSRPSDLHIDRLMGLMASMSGQGA